MEKIVFVHPAYWEQLMGGAELQIKYIYEYALYLGWEVHYVFVDNGKKNENPLNLYLHPIKSYRIKRTFGSVFFLYHKKVKEILTEISPTIIYTRGAYSWSGIASQYAKSNGVRHIWAIASDSDPITKIRLNFHLFTKPFNLINNFWVKYAFKNSTIIVCQNSYQKAQIKEKQNRDALLITQMAIKANETEIIKDYSTIKVVWIANFKPSKRPDIFVKLANSFRGTTIEFIMVGKSADIYLPLLVNQNNIKYYGELNNDDVNRLLISSHLLVNTSEHEGFSNTFVQAWLRKVPVISMNSNPDEILTKNEIGFMCKTEVELFDAVKYFYENSDILKSMGEKAYNYSIENHATEKILPTLFKNFNTGR